MAELEAAVGELKEQLRRNEKMGRALNGSPRACLVADAEDDFRLFYANAAANAVFDQLAPWLHVPRDRVMGSRIDEVLGIADFAPSVISGRREALSGVYSVGEEWIDFYAAPVTDGAGRVIALFMAGSLVTRRRRTAEAVAAESEQMRASIADISRNAQGAAATANDAARTATAASETINRLNRSSAEISSVIQVINRIAAQTRLLALNATIEAARVGDAGRGFAVVASEVKQLAQETGLATAQVVQQVESIQAEAKEAVDAINSILQVVNRIDQCQAAIAAAVEQQTATTAELSRQLAESLS
ncbi:MAG TPA: methyl-accepting chemotaxis protein [Acidimicrobiales bacterium]|nr:methyl-accepting chemotaxis protein [Acidimicrobiales bacterium]